MVYHDWHVWENIGWKLSWAIMWHGWPACNITTGPVASCKWIWQKTAMGPVEQDLDLPCSASNVLGKVQSHLCLTKWQGKWKCWQGNSILGAACPAQKIMFCNLSCTLLVDVRVVWLKCLKKLTLVIFGCQPCACLCMNGYSKLIFQWGDRCSFSILPFRQRCISRF